MNYCRYVGTFRADLIDGEGLYSFKNRDSYNGQVASLPCVS
jgi:hypothetical protein